MDRLRFCINNFIFFYAICCINAADVIVGKIKDLSVTSQGPNRMSLRWLPPQTTMPLAYQVNIDTDMVHITFRMPREDCLLWPQYHCYDAIIETPKKESHRFRIFAINENSVEDINNEIDKATKLGLYGQVIAENWEKVPDPPYSVGFNWTNGLNVFWNHPNVTNGLVKHFTIKIELQYDKIGSDKITASYDIEDLSKYLFQYFRNFDINHSCKENYKLKQMELCVKTNLEKYESKCAKSDIIFPPPPTEYQGDIKFVYEGLKIPKLQRDCFLLFHNVYKASIFQRNEAEAELHEIMGHFKNNTSYSPSINKEIFTANRYNGDIIIPRDILDLTVDEKFIVITIVVVNELNGLRTVNFKSVEVWVRTMDNEADHLNLVLVVVLICLILCCFIYRCSRQIFKTRRPNNEDIALYVATGETVQTSLRGESTLYEPIDDFYDWILKDQQPSEHSKIINVDNLRDYIKSAIESEELSRQHQMVSKTTNIPKSDCGRLPQNKDKNRYNNIVAYDHTRVRLVNSSQDSDYINANYIDGYQFSKAYIAAQGPKPNTVNDFWTMIWENSVEYVVMLCSLYDGNKKNCEQYWPNKDSMDFNELTVQFIDNKVLPTFEKRMFRIGLNGKSRMITQIHFTLPPVGQALFPHTLMPLLQMLLSIPYKNNSPILVHCSAGVGRTGTIILCDICLRMAAAKNQVDILNIFERLRKQRPNMVDNIEQYKLAHLAILTSLTASDFLINNNKDFEARVDKMLKENQIQTQMAYIRDSGWQDDAMKTLTTAVQRFVPIIAEKNRFPDILPDEISQVFLQQLPNQDSTSCYINAIHVNSLYTPNRYIVTQQPLSTTLADFWRLVFEQQCPVIVNLSSIDQNAKTSVPFWSKEGIDQNLHIQLDESRHVKQTSLNSLSAIYKPNDFEQRKLKVQIINFNGWPSGNLIPENLEDFVFFVVKFFATVGNDIRPIVVTCYDGATASGFFIALATLIEQIRTENCFDLCQIVRTIRACRKQFVNNRIQLAMLYSAAKIYVKQFILYEVSSIALEAQEIAFKSRDLLDTNGYTIIYAA